MHMHEKYTRVYLVSISIENVSFWVCIHCSTRTNQWTSVLQHGSSHRSANRRATRRAKELMSSIFVRVVILCWRLALSVSLRKIVCGMKNRSADNRRFTEKNKTKTEKYNAENEEEQKKKRHQNDSQRKLRSKTKPKSSYCFSVYYKLNIIIEMKKKTGDSKHFISVWNQWEPLEPAFRHSLWKKISVLCAPMCAAN